MNHHRPYGPGTVMLLVGTKRGLFLLTSTDREAWNIEAPSLRGHRIFHAILDQRDGHRLFATDNGDFFGTFLRYSDDFGQTWKEPERGIQFPQDSGEKLNNIWVIEPATIIPDPSNTSRMWVGISAVGCMRTDDGGRSWVFANKNTRADFLPTKYPEFGQCIHRLVQHPTRPNVLYQQNHCGIYKSTNAGDDWTDIQQNLPSEFGFPIALDVHNPDTVFVVVEDPMARHNVDKQFTVYRTGNGGEQWEPLTQGLPQGPGVLLGVLRHAMCTDVEDPCGVYVGTNTGQLFASRDRGDNWHLVADFLPPIYSVTAAVLA